MFLDSLFEKRITIYKKKDSATWKQIRKVLKDAGLKGGFIPWNAANNLGKYKQYKAIWND